MEKLDDKKYGGRDVLIHSLWGGKSFSIVFKEGDVSRFTWDQATLPEVMAAAESWLADGSLPEYP